MKILGGIMLLVSIFVIGYNLEICAENEAQLTNHPIGTLLVWGSNLKSAYTFTPPFTAFEVFIFALGVLGIIFLCIPKANKD